jgi:hypothetical protein
MSEYHSMPFFSAVTSGGAFSAHYEMKYIDEEKPRTVVSMSGF